MATLFLELDDEITSAVARLREAREAHMALVLPAGSRLASSRINFRLLAREAEELGTTLAIVSPEASARALAAAAGLASYDSVRRYEAALAGGGGASGGGPPHEEPSAGGPRGPAGASSAGPAGGDTGTTMTAAPGRLVREHDLPVARSAGRGPSIRLPGRTVLVGLLVVAVLGSGTAAGAYFVLPEARVTVTPRVEAFGPLVLELTADPDAAEVDLEAGLVPARTVESSFEVSDAFPATGVKVTETRASGRVRFSNLDPTADGAVTIPARSVVRTPGGIRFRTQSQVTVPKATLDGTTIIPSTRNVDVEAVEAGTGGNVGANTITVIPGGYDPDFLKVTNPQPTSGGTRVETKVVRRADYDSAVAELSARIGDAFDAWLSSTVEELGEGVVLTGSAELDEPTVDVPPEQLVDSEAQEFTLAAQAAARVVAFDPAVLPPLAESLFRETEVPAGYLLIEDSIRSGYRVLETDDPARPRYEVTASGRGYRQLDAVELETLILGRPLGEAADLLRPYGEAVLSLEPDWFGTIPQLEWRVTVTVRTPDEAS